jgi:hypothetical protein
VLIDQELSGGAEVVSGDDEDVSGVLVPVCVDDVTSDVVVSDDVLGSVDATTRSSSADLATPTRRHTRSGPESQRDFSGRSSTISTYPA